jgi:hypothetical protein
LNSQITEDPFYKKSTTPRDICIEKQEEEEEGEVREFVQYHTSRYNKKNPREIKRILPQEQKNTSIKLEMKRLLKSKTRPSPSLHNHAPSKNLPLED